MSGGVDSSVAAWLLAQQVPIYLLPTRVWLTHTQDFDLSAVFMRNWDTRDESGTDRGCEWERDLEDVRRVCRALGVRSRMVSLFRPFHRVRRLNVRDAGRPLQGVLDTRLRARPEDVGDGADAESGRMVQQVGVMSVILEES
jgi:NH3-dependent NAD+ synthetase